MNVCSPALALPAFVAVLAMGAPVQVALAAGPVGATLDIAVEDHLTDHMLIEQWLAEQTGPALAEVGVEIGSASPEYGFSLQIGGEDYDYVVRIRREGPDPASVEARCACSKSDVVTFAVEKLVAASEDLEPTSTGSEPAEPPEETTADAPGDDRSTPSGARIGALGYTGIVALVGGAGALVAGGVLLAKGEEQSLLDGDAQQLLIEDHRPGGRIALGVGVGAVALGVVFIALDQTVMKARRRQVALTPSFGPRGAALGLTGRF
jgi:hypothetical protein